MADKTTGLMLLLFGAIILFVGGLLTLYAPSITSVDDLIVIIVGGVVALFGFIDASKATK